MYGIKWQLVKHNLSRLDYSSRVRSNVANRVINNPRDVEWKREGERGIYRVNKRLERWIRRVAGEITNRGIGYRGRWKISNWTPVETTKAAAAAAFRFAKKPSPFPILPPRKIFIYIHHFWFIVDLHHVPHPPRRRRESSCKSRVWDIYIYTSFPSWLRVEWLKNRWVRVGKQGWHAPAKRGTREKGTKKRGK